MAVTSTVEDALQNAQLSALDLFINQCFGESASSADCSEVSRVEDSSFHHVGFSKLAEACRDADTALSQVSPELLSEKFENCINDFKVRISELAEGIRKGKEDREILALLSREVKEMEDLVVDSCGSGDCIVPIENAAVGVGAMRELMEFAELAMLDASEVLGKITKSEIDSVSHLSLGVLKRLLPMGEAYFSSVSEPRKATSTDRSEHITIEELPDDSPCGSDKDDPAASGVIRTELMKLLLRFKNCAASRPYLTGAMTALGIPFAGLLIPLASIAGAAVLLEKYAPEYTQLMWEVVVNAIHVLRLWYFCVKIWARYCTSLATKQLQHLRSSASEKGIVMTVRDVARTSISFGSYGLRQLGYLSQELSRSIFQ